MRNSAADGVSRRSALDGLVAETAAGRLLLGVHRCLLRVERPRWPEGWTGAATTHRDDRGGLDADVAFRMPSVTKMMTATALLVLGDQGRCRLDDPTGRHLPSDVVDRFHDRQGRLRCRHHLCVRCWITPSALRMCGRLGGAAGA